MEGITFEYTMWSLLLGCLVGSSLMIGAFLSLIWKPQPAFTSALTAFGAGALLAALSLELVAPTAAALVEPGEGAAGAEGEGHNAVAAMVWLLVGSISGGLIFVVFDKILNAKGGYLRKAATAISYLGNRRKKQISGMLERLGQIEFIRSIPPEQVHSLIDYVRPITFQLGQQLFSMGDVGDRLYFLEEGDIGLAANGEEFKTLHAGDVVGEIALVTGAPRTASATAKTRVVAFELLKADFDRLRKLSPDLDAAITRITSQRLEDLQGRQIETGNAAQEWASVAKNNLGHIVVPTQDEIHQAAEEHGGAPMSIWLGTVLDSIPESFALGGAFLAMLTAKMASGPPSFGDIVPFTLIAGLFLSNLPESMSSSVGMRAQGWKSSKILLLWFSLTFMVVVSTVVGYILGSQLDHTVMVAVEGLAAGAMLTMIAQTMIPEAVHLGSSSTVGLSTLIGFLSAVAFKLLEA